MNERPAFRYVIGLDQGSSSTKGILYDCKSRRVVAKERVRVATQRCYQNDCLFVEHDPQEILASANQTIRKLLKLRPRRDPTAVAIASQRSSFLLVDRQALKPITPVLSWQDTRAQALVARYQNKASLIHQKTGLYLTPYYSLMKLLWLLEKNPQWRAQAQQGNLLFAFIPTYLVLKWTQGRVHAADPTLAQRSLLFNIERLTWDHDLLKRFKINAGMLPQIKQTRDDYGVIAKHFFDEELPIMAMVGDQQCAFLALQNNIAKNSALMNLGTGGFLLIPTGLKLKKILGLLAGILGAFESKPHYLIEGTVNSISSTLRWLNDAGILTSKETLAIMANKSSQIPSVVGSFGGLAAPYWRSDMNLNILNLRQTTSRQDLIAGCLYGLVHHFWEILNLAQKSNLIPKRLVVAGGLSKNRYFLQAFADYLNIPIDPSLEPDLTALGACAAAGAKLSAQLLKFDKPIKPSKKRSQELLTLRQQNHQALQKFICL